MEISKLTEDGGFAHLEKSQVLLPENEASFFGRRRSGARGFLALVAIAVIGLFYIQLQTRPQTTALLPSNPSNPPKPPPRLVKYDTPSANATTTSSAVLAAATNFKVNFGVYQPVLTPEGAVDQTISNDGTSSTGVVSAASTNGTCATVVLMDYSFGQSYGVPFVGSYAPPSCAFNRVVMNFTVTSQGRQFDRLAMLYFNNTEVWRTSTEEPTSKGIQWTYMKDMTEYLPMWKEAQKIIFDLPNNVDSTYTGLYNTTLTATFFQSDALSAVPADMIIPITAEKGASNAASMWALPAENASSTVSFPQNANRAVFSVSACGQADEEFWWGNVLSTYVDTFNASGAGELFGGSAWREVQIFIDGQMAGVQWPFPIIFTGGILPALWEPIVGIDAFDLREHQIDITPWLPLLCDGNQHSFEIRVASLADAGNGIIGVNDTVPSSWYVTGKVFVWLDSEGSVTTGTQPTISNPGPKITTYQDVTQNSTGFNQSLINEVTVTRTMSISSTVKTANGSTACSWTQTLSFSNNGSISNQGLIQYNTQMTQGTDQSTGNTNYKNTYGYPFIANTTQYAIDTNPADYRYDALVTRGLTHQIEGTSLYPTGLEPFSIIPRTSSIISHSAGSVLSTNSTSTASLIVSNSGNSTTEFGSNEQNFSFGSLSQSGAMGEDSTGLYSRFVRAVNGSVVRNMETVGGVVGSDFSNETVVGEAGVSVGRRVNTARFRQGGLKVWGNIDG